MLRHISELFCFLLLLFVLSFFFYSKELFKSSVFVHFLKFLNFFSSVVQFSRIFPASLKVGLPIISPHLHLVKNFFLIFLKKFIICLVNKKNAIISNLIALSHIFSLNFIFSTCLSLLSCLHRTSAFFHKCKFRLLLVRCHTIE